MLEVYILLDFDILWNCGYQNFGESTVSITLKMETVCFSKILVSACKSTWRHNPKEHIDMFTTVRTSNLTNVRKIILSFHHICMVTYLTNNILFCKLPCSKFKILINLLIAED